MEKFFEDIILGDFFQFLELEEEDDIELIASTEEEAIILVRRSSFSGDSLKELSENFQYEMTIEIPYGSEDGYFRVLFVVKIGEWLKNEKEIQDERVWMAELERQELN